MKTLQSNTITKWRRPNDRNRIQATLQSNSRSFHLYFNKATDTFLQ